MSINIEAEINKKTINVPVELQSLTQDIEVNFVPSIIYAFSPFAKIEELQNGNYLITITDKNGTTTGEIPVVTQETIDNFIDYYMQSHSIYLDSIDLAGLPITVQDNSVTKQELANALQLAAAAYKNIDLIITKGSISQNIPTSQAVSRYVATAASKITQSEKNGYIKVDDIDTSVYTLPSSVVDQTDILILNGGNASSTYI